MNSDEKHRKSAGKIRTKGTIIQFESDFMSHAINNYYQFRKIKHMLQESSRGIKLLSPSGSIISQLLDSIPNDSGILQVNNILLLLQEMTSAESRCLTSQHYSIVPFSNSRIDRVKAFLNINYTRKIKLNEIASIIAMNPSAFCRFFKEKTGKSLIRYIMKLRVGHACKLLMMNEMNVSQISSECGFESMSHFNRMFRRITGTNPTTYRNQMVK